MFITSRTEDAVATITLNRPKKLNAFTGTMREDLLAALRAAERDASVRAVVITGAGRAFCAGGDVEFMASLQERNDVAAFRRLLDAGRDIVLQIASMPKVVIAAVNGVAAGAGCNLALACDYRIAAGTARFSESFVKIGLHPDWGGTWLLPRLVGRSRALELMATGRMVEAAEALAIGLVDRVANDLPSEAASMARTFASASTLPLFKRALQLQETNGLAAQLDLEAEHQVECFQSEAARARIAGFVRKAGA